MRLLNITKIITRFLICLTLTTIEKKVKKDKFPCKTENLLPSMIYLLYHKFLHKNLPKSAENQNVCTTSVYHGRMLQVFLQPTFTYDLRQSSCTNVDNRLAQCYFNYLNSVRLIPEEIQELHGIYLCQTLGNTLQSFHAMWVDSIRNSSKADKQFPRNQVCKCSSRYRGLSFGQTKS